MVLKVREGTARFARATWAEALRVQAAFSLVVAVLIPAMIRYPDLELRQFGIPAVLNSIVGAACAVLLGLLLLRRVTAFPGTRAFGYILPSYASAYGIVVLAMFGLRLEYSRFYLGASFAAALLGAYLFSLWLNRRVRRRFYVVPAGRTDFILDIPDVEWVVMSAPTVPRERTAAIVADLRFDHEPEWERMLAEAAVAGHSVYHTKQLRESLTGRVSIEHMSENSFGSLMPNLAYRKVKRLFDLAMTLLLIPVVALPMALIALAIRLDSPGPALFRQTRMGYRGVPFSIFKFRTMRTRASIEDEAEARNDAMTMTDDARITRVGRFLRRSRLDELPQIFNVLAGQMSLIGPRPEAVPLSLWYESELPFYFYRHIVRPGLTGWAQVNQGHVSDLEAVNEKLNFDFYYIKNFSAWLDILILLRTGPTMISGFGSK